jgi:hypothetical protein
MSNSFLGLEVNSEHIPLSHGRERDVVSPYLIRSPSRHRCFKAHQMINITDKRSAIGRTKRHPSKPVPRVDILGTIIALFFDTEIGLCNGYNLIPSG